MKLLFTKNKESIERINKELHEKKKMHRKRLKDSVHSVDDESKINKLNTEKKMRSIRSKMDRYRSN